MVSVLLGFCVVGGAVYFVLKTDKIPALNKIQVDDKPEVGTDFSLGRRDISHGVVAESIPVGSVVKCIEGGKVIYSNTGCNDGASVKGVEMHYAAGIVSPTREVVDATVAHIFAERAAENRRLDELVARSPQVTYLSQVGIVECKRLQDRNSDIDRQANEVLTVWSQDQLRDEKNQNIKRQFDLRC